jgi:hypothetical protein
VLPPYFRVGLFYVHDSRPVSRLTVLRLPMHWSVTPTSLHTICLIYILVAGLFPSNPRFCDTPCYGSFASYTHLYRTLPFIGEVHASSPGEVGLHPAAYIPDPHETLCHSIRQGYMVYMCWSGHTGLWLSGRTGACPVLSCLIFAEVLS